MGSADLQFATETRQCPAGIGRSCIAAGGVQQERERREAPDPDAGAQQMHHVDGQRPRALGDRGCVA